MKILFDTNVILDELLERAPFYRSAAKLFEAVELQHLTGYLAATTVTTIHYLAVRTIGIQKSHREIANLLLLFAVASVNHTVLTAALHLPFRDYEDAVIHEAARLADVDGIVTRDGADFVKSTLPVYTPEELLVLLKLQ